MKRVSMQDIADELGISKNSVSQALRNTTGVSEETKKAVLEAAQLLGYDYKGKKAAQKGKIILLATNFAFSQTSFFGEIVESIKESCEGEGYHFSTETITEAMIEAMTFPQDIYTYDGIVILSHSNNEYIKKIIGTEIPCVLIDHHDPALLADAVLSKNTDGTYLAISLLHENQHQRIGFLGDIDFSPSYLERYRGYKRALTDRGIPLDEDVEITEIEESQGSLFNRLKEVKKMPDAWFCVNSGLAFMLTSYLQSNGYTIPEDISIICYDETEFTRMAQPPITNVATNLDYMGQLAVRRLIERIADPQIPYLHEQIVPTLNIRKSVRLTECE